jgi:hypothetical protein
MVTNQLFYQGKAKIRLQLPLSFKIKDKIKKTFIVLMPFIPSINKFLTNKYTEKPIIREEKYFSAQARGRKGHTATKRQNSFLLQY